MLPNPNSTFFNPTTTTATFGFGNANPSVSNQQQPFAQSFGPFGRSSAFGSANNFNSTNAFGTAGNFVSTNNNNTFGMTSNFGTANTFGSTFQQPPVLPVQNKPGFLNIFGPQNATPFKPQNQASSGFGDQVSTSVFGQPSTSFTQTGTSIKYNPVYGTDSNPRLGITSTVNTKHCCITGMKEYENKSLEELRYEDYQSNRKGLSQQQQVPGFAAKTNVTQHNPQGFFNKTPNIFSAIPSAAQTDTMKPFGMTTQNIFAPTTSTTTSFGLGQMDKFNLGGLFNKPPQATAANQQSSFTFGTQAKPPNTFEPPKFTPSSFIPKTTPALNFQPIAPPVTQATGQQPFQFRFAAPSQPLINKPASDINIQTYVPPQQHQITLEVGEAHEFQLQEFRTNVQQVFQQFPRREFLKTASPTVATEPRTCDLHTKFVAKPPTVNKILYTRTSSMKLEFDVPPIPPGLKTSRRMLTLRRNIGTNKSPPTETLGIFKSTNPWVLMENSDNSLKKEGRCLISTRKFIPNSPPPSTKNTETQTDLLNIGEVLSDTDEEMTLLDSTASASKLEDSECQLATVPYIVKLEKSEYYTKPPLHALYKYVNDDGRCIIKGFTIGRVGYGKIYFPGEVDISNLDLDEIVNFGYREVAVYPDDNEKPPVGEGLNKPAQVTLDQIWPFNKQSEKSLKNSKEIEEVNFAAKLALLSERQDAKFVDYLPETGSWVFMVQHFSKFSFNDGEDDEITQAMELQSDEVIEHQNVHGGSASINIMKSAFFGDNLHVKNLTDIGISPKPAIKHRIRTYFPKHFALHNCNLETPILTSIPLQNYADMAVFKSRSYKVGWAQRHKFIYVSNSNHRLTHLQINSSTTTTSLNKGMEIVFSESLIRDTADVPLCTIEEGCRTLIGHQNLGSSKQVWNLCLALWGPDAVTPTACDELFGNWLENIISPFLYAEASFNPFQTVFMLLSGHKVGEATQLAMEHDLPRLAALISQASAQESVQTLICHQVHQWKDSGVINFISKDILKLYMLLGGIPVLGEVNVCENLGWKQALGVHFWYICRPGASVVDGIQAYRRGFELGYARPPYINRYMVYDVLYEIMLLYVTKNSSLINMLNPFTYGDDPLDYELSWMLLQTFTALKIGRVAPEIADCVHINFGSQLENMGLWNWSIFVLLFLKDKTLKNNLITSILERNLQPSPNASSLDCLVNDLKIPPPLIHAVMTENTPLAYKYPESFLHLIFANNWQQAHANAMATVVPLLMRSRAYNNLFVLLMNLLPWRDKISGWHTGVGLVLEVLNLNELFSSSHMNANHVMCQLISLCHRTKHFPAKTSEQRWCMAELSKVVAVVLRMFCSGLRPGDMQTVAANIERLAMPSDYKLQQLRHVEQSMIN